MVFDLNKVYEFSWLDLNYIELENELGIKALRILNGNLERSLTQTKLDFKKMVDQDLTLRTLDDEDKGSYYSQIFEREEWAIEELQRQQRYSLVLSIFSYFEGRLKCICNLIESRFKFKIKSEDLSTGEDLLRYWNYFEKVYEIETTSLNRFFTPLKQQKIIRNIIAHQEGEIRDNQMSKVNFLKGLSYKEIGNRKMIDIERDLYAEYLFEKLELFFKELLLQIDRRYRVLTVPPPGVNVM